MNKYLLIENMTKSYILDAESSSMAVGKFGDYVPSEPRESTIIIYNITGHEEDILSDCNVFNLLKFTNWAERRSSPPVPAEYFRRLK